MTEGRPLRVAIVAPPYYELPPSGYGGIELVCHLLAEGLFDRGHQVTLVGAGPRRTRADFIATFPRPQPEDGDAPLTIELAHAARAAAALERLDVDVVHDHTRLGPLTAVGRRAPTVLTVHVALAGPDSALVELEAVQRWAHPVAISHAQRRDAPEVSWAGTVHNAIAVQRYPLRVEKEDFLLYLGRQSAHKGVHLAIAAARATGRRLVIVGRPTTGEEHAYFEARVRPLLGDGVDWVGEVDFDRKVSLLGRAACLVFPALWNEPFGLVLIEAMACGTPVAALGRGAVPELVVDGETGVISQGPAGLAAAIERAVRLSPERCRAHVLARFDVARMVADYERVYRSLLESRPRQGS